MATNGESAKRWLEDNAATLTNERVQQIQDNILGKLETISDDDPAAQGLLDALEELDNYLNVNLTLTGSTETEVLLSATSGLELNTDTSSQPPVMFDTSPLIPESADSEPLSAEEKQHRFQQLLQKSSFGNP